MSASLDIGAWRRVLVYGLGLSGTAATRLLLDRGMEVVGVDRRPADELALGDLAAAEGFRIEAGGEPVELPEGVDAVVVSPGVPPDRPLLEEARRRGLPIVAEVELAFHFVDGPLVGITGSNGKSTTTALTGELLRAGGRAVEVCGNIGVPLSARVAGEPGRVFVVELSSFQLEGTVDLKPRAAAWLNLSVDHLDRHFDIDAYARAKASLFARQTEEDVAVLNADDPAVAAVATQARRRFFSRLGRVEDGCYLEGERVVEVTPPEEPVELFRRDDLLIPGEHNVENAMAAALLARALGIDAAQVRQGIGRFRGLPHRLELVARGSGVTWYDDSKGTNIAATQRSLEGFPDRSVHLILGGRHKGGEPDALAEMVRRKVRRLYYIGEAAESFRAALGDAAPGSVEGTMDAAVEAAAATAEPGEVVLLSPACASFDQYADFRHRGQHFQTLVAARLEDAGRGVGHG